MAAEAPENKLLATRVETPADGCLDSGAVPDGSTIFFNFMDDDMGLLGIVAIQQAIAFFCVLVYCSFFEYVLHRWVLHARFPLLPYPYKKHQLMHHVLMKGDETFRAQDAEAKSHITFVPVDWLLLIALHAILFYGFEILTGQVVMIGGLAAVVSYLAAFDILHLAFHDPRGWWFESHRWFLWLLNNHKEHHRTQYRRLNVVLPIAQFFFDRLAEKRPT